MKKSLVIVSLPYGCLRYMGMFAGALSGSDLVNSVKMRLKSLSGLTADEKRIKMRAMAEELQKVWAPRVFRLLELQTTVDSGHVL